MKRQKAIGIICSLIILLFLYAGLSKLLNMKLTMHDMHNQPFPNWLGSFLAWTVPITEILISASLLFDKWRLSGLYASFILTTLFTLYAAAILLHFFSWVPCGCGGIIRKLTWQQHFALTTGYAIISFVGIRLVKKEDKKQKEINSLQQPLYT